MLSLVQPHRRQPTRLPRPWDSPGKSTRVGCHFLLQCRKVKSENEVAQFFASGSQRIGVSTSTSLQFSSVQFSSSVVSDSLRPHESQHTRPPCPSPTPGVHSDSCPSSESCHPAISSSVIPFSSCPQSLPASGSFPMCQLFP